MDDSYAAVRLQAHRAVRTISHSPDDYFYLDLPDQRRAAIHEIVEHWSAGFLAGLTPELSPPASVPLHSAGGLRRDVVDRLLKFQDRRDVAIDE